MFSAFFLMIFKRVCRIEKLVSGFMAGSCPPADRQGFRPQNHTTIRMGKREKRPRYLPVVAGLKTGNSVIPTTHFSWNAQDTRLIQTLQGALPQARPRHCDDPHSAIGRSHWFGPGIKSVCIFRTFSPNGLVQFFYQIFTSEFYFCGLPMTIPKKIIWSSFSAAVLPSVPGDQSNAKHRWHGTGRWKCCQRRQGRLSRLHTGNSCPVPVHFP